MMIKIKQFNVYHRNRSELNRIRKEIFVNEEYKFVSGNKRPFIIDCGSHIGLSILYFKNIYPRAEILGFEPNPENFKILQKNVKVNKLRNVRTVNAALSDKDGEGFLRTDFEERKPWTWGDTIVKNMWGSEDDSKKIKIKTARLSKYIDKPVDLLKLDIEGSEQKVLEDIESKLRFVEQINMEFHGTSANRKVNSYKVIKKLLKDNGLKVKTCSKGNGLPFFDFVMRLQGKKIFTVIAVKQPSFQGTKIS